MIKISAKGLAKFMTGSDHSRRKVVRDYKYPDEEGIPQALYYREATEIIQSHHKAGTAPDWLLARAADLNKLAQTLSGHAATRRRHNARALQEYAASWGAKKFGWLGSPRFDWRHAGVRVTVVPDLHVMDGGDQRFVKLDFTGKAVDERVPKIISQLMYEAITAQGHKCRPADIAYYEVARNNVTKGARPGAHMTSEIRAACETIADIWERI